MVINAGIRKGSIAESFTTILLHVVRDRWYVRIKVPINVVVVVHVVMNRLLCVFTLVIIFG